MIDSLVRFPDEYGGGFMVNVEVFHQLHCLVRLLKVLSDDIV
jgi:hypothetical protein